MIKKIDHVVITTENISRCFEFYEKVGFTCKSSDGRYAIFAGDFKINVHIKGHELLPHAQNIQTGSADMCFEITESMNDFKNMVIKKGLKIELGVVERNGVNGAMHSVYLRDPDSNLVEFCNYE
ncbi:MAG: VOC family protein [Lachnospiraceae bacterium]